MGRRFDALSQRHREFIAQQKIFFVGTATTDSRVNFPQRDGSASD